MTNGDKVRTMSDEELANLLRGDCKICKFHNEQLKFCVGHGQCYEGSLKWLQSEYIEDVVYCDTDSIIKSEE